MTIPGLSDQALRDLNRVEEQLTSMRTYKVFLIVEFNGIEAIDRLEAFAIARRKLSDAKDAGSLATNGRISEEKGL